MEPLSAPDPGVGLGGGGSEAPLELTDLLEHLFQDGAPELSERERAGAYALALKRSLERLQAQEDENDFKLEARVATMQELETRAISQMQMLPIFRSWRPLARILALSLVLNRELRALS